LARSIDLVNHAFWLSRFPFARKIGPEKALAAAKAAGASNRMLQLPPKMSGVLSGNVSWMAGLFSSVGPCES